MEPVQHVAIIGAGNMGSGIAQKSAQEGFDVQMVDREQPGSIVARDHRRLPRRSGGATDLLRSRSGRHQGPRQGRRWTENTAPSTDLVIEAVFEDFDVKTAVFSTLDDVCEPHTILASNTSSLSVNALAEATGRPDRFVGLHFFYHPAKNRLVEVIPRRDDQR